MIAWLIRGARFGLQFRFWVALCVAALARFIESLLYASADPGPPIYGTSVRIVFAATLTLYNLDGTLDATQREASLGQRRRAHLLLTAASGLWLQLELFLWRSWYGAAVFLGFLICALYAVRLKVGGRSLQLKAIPGIKAPFIGGAVGIAVVLVPWWVKQSQGVGPNLSSLWPLAVTLACFCTTNALLFDLPDLNLDRRLRVPTVVAKRGPQRAKRVALLWIALGFGCLLRTRPAARLPLAALGLALVVAGHFVKSSSKKSTVAVWVDGALCLPLILLNLWN